MKNPSKSSSPRTALTRTAFRTLAATLGVTAGAGLLGLSNTVQAADDIWVYSGTPGSPTADTATSGGGTANYDDGPTGYWSLGVKPTGNSNNAVINNAGTVNITANENPVDVLLGTVAGGTGTFNQSAGTVSMVTGWFRLGTFAGSATSNTHGGTYNLSGGSLSLTSGVAQQMNIAEGAYSNATLTVSGTGVVGGNFGVLNVGRDAGSVGTLNVNTGGVFNMIPTAAPGGTANSNTLSVGNAGTGTVNVNGGVLNLTPTVAGNLPLVVGRASGSNGTVNVSSGTLNVGSSGGVQELWVSANPGATGLVNVTGGTLNVSSWLAIGRGGNNGTLNVNGGVVNGAVNGGNITLSGINGTSVGVANVTSGSLNTPNNLYVTESGSGTLNISGTGVVNEYGGTGVRINTTANTNTAAVGTVNLGNGAAGGLLSVNNVSTGNTNATQSVFNFNGGTLQAKFNSGDFLRAGTANVRNGGAIIDTNGVNVTVGQVLAHSNITGDNTTDGGLTKLGTGALVLTGANNYTGNTTINAGVVDAQTTGSLPGLNTAGRVTVNSTGILAVGVGYSTGQTLADVDTARANNTFNSGSGIGIDLAAAASPANYATNLTNDAGANGANTGFAKLGAGTLTLTGNNTYSGITRFYGGVLGGNIGTGPLVFNGGGWQLPGNNAVNYSTRAVTFNGTAAIDTNGNDVTLGTAIVGLGGGSLTKLGNGNLTLSGGFNFSPTRAFAPGTAVLGNVFVQGGALTLSGTAEVLNSGGNYASIGVVGGNQGTLNIIGGASFTTTSDFNIADVGGTSAATLNGGVVNLTGAASALNVATLFVGKGTSTTAQFANGVFNQSGGTFTAAGNVQIGAFGLGQYNLTGGSFNHTSGFISIARQANSFGTVDINGAGAVLNDTAVGTRTIVGELGTGVLNVRNGGVLNANNSTTATSTVGLSSALAALTIGNTGGTAASPTVGIVNLLPGGTINTQSIGSVTGASNVTSQLNFNGGTLRNTAPTGTFIQNLTQANVYAGGAIIDTTAGSATIAQPLVAPAGNGVTGISASGTGFSSTPLVQITGGGGVGATAIATVDVSGNLTGVTVTNPGTGYTSAPTVTITGAFGTTTTGTATFGANTSGGLTKLGTNTLTLTGVNTYTGPTTISAGTLALTGTGSIAASNLITTASGATLSLGANTVFGPGQTLTGTGIIQGGANTLTINGTVSPGTTTAAGDLGTLQIATTSTLSLSSTALIQFDIATAASKDLINAAGANLTLSGTLALRGTIDPSATYTIFSGLASENGNPTTVTGTPSGYQPVFAFAGGNYNLSFVAVPEPSTWMLGVFGLGGLATVWMRRRRLA